jgi:hypothetical protein
MDSQSVGFDVYATLSQRASQSAVTPLVHVSQRRLKNLAILFLESLKDGARLARGDCFDGF